uniref:Guanine nucleotide-binding protein subunit gamma n=1 Tax=Leptobrachium leishanense TaxID=445787 RepID=A0A8C5QQW4_9ANUR
MAASAAVAPARWYHRVHQASGKVLGDKRSTHHCRMAQDMTEKDVLRMEVEQLKKEIKTERIMVSKSAQEMKTYVESLATEDPLLKGVPEDKNPFKEKGGCSLS